MELGGWSVVVVIDDCEMQTQHVVPLLDAKDHMYIDCECCPTAELDNPSVFVHHSFDGREEFENGWRKVS
jgi:hypothetical protein